MDVFDAPLSPLERRVSGREGSRGVVRDCWIVSSSNYNLEDASRLLHSPRVGGGLPDAGDAADEDDDDDEPPGLWREEGQRIRRVDAARRTSAHGLLGSLRPRDGHLRGAVHALPHRRTEARPHCDVGGDRVLRAGVHRDVRGHLPVVQREGQVFGHSPRLPGDVQASHPRRLPDPSLHRPPRNPVPQRQRRLRHGLLRPVPRGTHQIQEVGRRNQQRTPRHARHPRPPRPGRRHRRITLRSPIHRHLIHRPLTSSSSTSSSSDQ
mmetsp:Transcript_15214/g.49575  ORF Transcript_15214/g.49575 Transcript_15214/m.49575 type:complete len:265 (+) Transcript_15214:1906-2700(+)